MSLREPLEVEGIRNRTIGDAEMFFQRHRYLWITYYSKHDIPYLSP